MIKHILTTLIFAASFILFSSSTLAAEGFTTDIESSYYIDQNGIANVTQTTHLTNEVANVYATEYELSIGSNRVRNIVALNSEGQKIPFTTRTAENATIVNLQFNQKVVGRGKTRTFTVTYQNPDVAQKEGNILEVSIPKLSRPEDVSKYTVLVRVPTFFGHPTLLNPQADTVETVANTTNVSFSDQSIKNEGVVAIFGDQQVFNFILNYHLQNDNITPIATQIALPPDTPFQKMIYHRMEPIPKAMDMDKNGNWIATFELEAKESLTVTASASATITITPTQSSPSLNISPADFTKADSHWPIDDPLIKQVAGQYNTPEKIYDYLVNNFNYNYARIDNQSTQRLGAKQALSQPDNALCLEFTDAFVAIARAAGIPSRAVLGYAHTQNPQLRPLSLIQDVLHAWPEYYDAADQRWVPIDPTWGNTTGGIDYFSHLDFNHVAFAIQGTSSTQPYPVGYYKFPGQQSKDIQVTLGDTPPTPEPLIKMEVPKNPTTTFANHIKMEVTLKNDGNSALYNQPLTISSGSTTIKEVNVPILLPFQTVNVPVEFAPDQTIQNTTVDISYHDQSIEQPIKQSSVHPSRLIAFGIAVAGTLAFFALRPWRVLVSE